MNEPPVHIENRTQLVYLLSEAAELEHGIGCCYLFAAFSFKSSVDEGVSQAQLRAITGWKRTVMDVAVQEMLHLGLVCNLLTAIGAAPHIRRPNLPTSPTMYPKSFELDLRPFSEKALSNFIFLERPETEASSDGDGPDASAVRRGSVRTRDIFFDRPEYETVGHLYRGIEDGFTYLAQKYGEDRLFAGSPESQATEYPRLPELTPVTDLASAVHAIQQIVEQGEGARGENEDGHYARFLRIQTEYAALKSEDAAFEPARPVVVNPYTHLPVDLPESADVTILDDPFTIAVCNLFDGTYELLIQMLGRYFARAGDSESEAGLLGELTTNLMSRVMSPLGSLITSLPAGPSHPGFTAGPSFYLPRSIQTPPRRQQAVLLWRERLNELSGYCALLETFNEAPPVLARIRQNLELCSTKLAEVGGTGS